MPLLYQHPEKDTTEGYHRPYISLRITSGNNWYPRNQQIVIIYKLPLSRKSHIPLYSNTHKYRDLPSVCLVTLGSKAPAHVMCGAVELVTEHSLQPSCLTHTSLQYNIPGNKASSNWFVLVHTALQPSHNLLVKSSQPRQEPSILPHSTVAHISPPHIQLPLIFPS